MKFHCHPRCQATSDPSRAVGAAKGGESGRARKRAVGEGPVNLLEERRVYRDATWREAGGTSFHVRKSALARIQKG